MSDKPSPYLCGGVLFLLLNQVKKARLSARDSIKGGSYKNSNPEIMKDLIYALTLCDADKDGGLYFSPSLGKDVSNYINCVINSSENLPFDQVPFISNYRSLVEHEYMQAMKKMQAFVQKHIDRANEAWLVAAIVDVIERDTDIAESEKFFIDYSGIPKTKEEIRSMDTFYLPAVLVGVMHYILINRGNNMAGKDTLDAWSTKTNGKPRRYHGDAGACIGRQIKVIQEYPIAVTESDIHKAGEQKIIIEQAEIPNDKSCLLEKADGMQDRHKTVSDVVVLQSENIEEQPENKKHASPLDEQLFEYFKTNTQDTLAYIIEHDPAGKPTDRLLPYNLDQLTKYWKHLAPKIENTEMKATVFRILDLLSQYRQYISDEFLRVVEDQNFLIFRNQSAEDGCKLEEILRPKTTELRNALRKEYRRIHNMPDIDQAFLDMILPEEEEPPITGFRDPPE